MPNARLSTLPTALANGEKVADLTDIRGTAFVTRHPPANRTLIDSTSVDEPGRIEAHPNPYEGMEPEPCAEGQTEDNNEPAPVRLMASSKQDTHAIRLPSAEAVTEDPVLYAHASRVFHKETNPHNALPLIQAHGDREVWLNPPPIPLETDELDWVFELPYQRLPHPSYGDAAVPAMEMIQHSVNIMRGCFGGCTFCSITEHEGRIIQSRSEASVLREVERIRDTSPAFTGVISDLGGPTANMWRIACKDKETEAACRKLSCVYPGICKNLNTDHTPLINLYRKARETEGVKKVLIASGLRYDLAVESPEYVRELVTHHVGGYLKIAPEHTESGPLSKMMKPGMGSYDRFAEMFERFSREAGKKQYLIPYFIAAHPGTTDEDMMHLALWLKQHRFRADQVQTFYPSPMATATAMYHTGMNPLQRVKRDSQVAEHREKTESATPAQGLSALPRPRQLAPFTQSAETDGPARSHRQRREASCPLAATTQAPSGGETARRQLSHPAHRGASWQRSASLNASGRSPSTDAAINSPNWRNSTRRGVFFRHIKPI